LYRNFNTQTLNISTMSKGGLPPSLAFRHPPHEARTTWNGTPQNQQTRQASAENHSVRESYAVGFPQQKNKLTPAEAERLAVLLEEMKERR
jgi:hypothetical protein